MNCRHLTIECMFFHCDIELIDLIYNTATQIDNCYSFISSSTIATFCNQTKRNICLKDHIAKVKKSDCSYLTKIYHLLYNTPHATYVE